MPPSVATPQLTDTWATIAADAARRAAPELRQWWGRPRQVDEKAAAGDLVTEVDRRAEEMIADEIFRRWPDSTIVGEEGGTMGHGRVQWFVDPIDGTSNFVHGIPFFCTSIAASVDGHVVSSAILDPVRDELFTASHDSVELNGQSLRRVHRPCGPGEAAVLTAFPYEGKPADEDQLARFGRFVQAVGSVRRLGSIALELAYIAAGRGHAAFELRTRPWDVAAGQHLVEQAGGTYRTRPLGDPTPIIDKHLSRSFVACRPGFSLPGDVVELLDPLFDHELG